MACSDQLDLSWLFGEDEGPASGRSPLIDGDLAVESVPQSQKRRYRKKKIGCFKQQGRPSIDQQFPNIIETARSFVEANGFEAHRRRHTPTGTCGVSLGQIRSHLFETIPGLREAYPNLGINTIHSWMKPPNVRNVTAAKRYKGFIDAKVGVKKNSKTEDREDTHYCRARVKYALEMVAELGEDCAVISMDNKNKVRIGHRSLAVDRRLQPGRFFPAADGPDFYDHDFPTPGQLITPAGYLVMEQGTPQYYMDDKGREHLRFDRSGTTYVVNRGPTTPCNIQSHMDDLEPLVEELISKGKTSVLLMVDNGPDFNPRSHINQYYFGELWRKTGLDALGVTSYCAGDSKLNPIERIWGVLTKKLTGCYLSDILPGDSVPPRQQGLSPDNLRAKEGQVVNQALQQLDHYWQDIVYNQHPIITTHVPHEGPTNRTTDTLSTVSQALSSRRSLHNHPDIQNRFKISSQHLRRHDGLLIFGKCSSTSCTHCTAHPLVKPQASQSFLHFRSPTMDENGHFLTYLESKGAHEGQQIPDSCMPSRRDRQDDRCGICTCYLFTSNADKTRHRRLLH